MILYLLFCVLAILLTVIALGITIGGLMKKRRKVWIAALSAFVVLSLISVFSVVTYAKKSIDYIGSEEFQEETRKSAENWGKNIGNTVSGAADGLEATLDTESIAKLAEKSGVIIGSGVSAIATGYDDTTKKHSVYASEEITKLGLDIGRAEWKRNSGKNSLGLYLAFKSEFEGTLRLTAYDRDGNKIDNSEITTTQKIGQDKVFIFEFEHLNPLHSEYCILTGHAAN